MMDKTELLFRMMEQPEKYDDEQWRAILSDKDCRELYATMSLTKSALDAQHCDQQTDETTIQEEWERFVAAHPDSATPHRPWRRIAAVAAIAIAFFSLVAAAVHTRCFGLLPAEKAVIEDTRQAITNMDTTVNVTNIQEEIPLSDASHLYDNVPLEQIINDMSAYYNVQVEWRSDEARNLRLYYQWEPSFTLDKVVDMLNSFEAINITREGDKIIIKQAE